MRWFEDDAVRFWMCEHQKLGLLIFDPSRSLCDRDDAVNLFITSENRWALFNRLAVKAKLIDRNTFDRNYPLNQKITQKTFRDACLVASMTSDKTEQHDNVSPSLPTGITSTYTTEDYYPDLTLSTGTRAYDPSSGRYNTSVF